MMKLYPLLLVSVLASGCVRTAAKTTPDAPPLDMPAPPPRENPPRPAEPAKPVEPPKIEPPIETPLPVEEAPRPPSTLQTTPTTAEGEVERGIRASLSRANLDLNRIDYRLLNADAKTQYDTAKRFIRQADDAMRAKNLVFAKSLADKAAALAAQLGGK